MSSDRAAAGVTDLILVPRHVFTQAIIQPRKPLSPTAAAPAGSAATS